MHNAGVRPSRHDLREHGIRNIQIAYWNLGAARLVEKALDRGEGVLVDGGGGAVAEKSQAASEGG